MCELFAINASAPIARNDYLREFYSHSHQHPDGWGICWRQNHHGKGSPDPFDERDVVLHKEPVPAWKSTYLPHLLERPIAARHLTAHIRRSTVGRNVVENCHPFVASDSTGRVWTMAHNGVLFIEGHLEGYERLASGETDSERTLLFLMDVLDEASLRHGGDLDFETRFDAIAGAIAQLTDHNRVNIILDDGDYTYVHTNTMEDTLHFRELDENGVHATVFSTQALGGEAERDLWKTVPSNRLIAYRDGRLVKTSAPRGYTICQAMLELQFAFDAERHVGPESALYGGNPQASATEKQDEKQADTSPQETASETKSA